MIWLPAHWEKRLLSSSGATRRSNLLFLTAPMHCSDDSFASTMHGTTHNSRTTPRHSPYKTNHFHKLIHFLKKNRPLGGTHLYLHTETNEFKHFLSITYSLNLMLDAYEGCYLVINCWLGSSTYRSIYLPIDLSIYLSIYLPIDLPFDLSIYLSIYL